MLFKRVHYKADHKDDETGGYNEQICNLNAYYVRSAFSFSQVYYSNKQKCSWVEMEFTGTIESVQVWFKTRKSAEEFNNKIWNWYFQNEIVGDRIVRFDHKTLAIK